jgi:hypothetical protein
LIRKFFPLDKNYILEQAQLAARSVLLKQLSAKAAAAWSGNHNPLGLDDDFSRLLSAEPVNGYSALVPFYDLLAGIYRLRSGDNQLQFLWTGADHHEQFAQEWSNAFHFWISEFCRDANFVQAVLDLTWFLPQLERPDFTGARMEHFLLKYFNLRKCRSTGMFDVRVSA